MQLLILENDLFRIRKS